MFALCTSVTFLRPCATRVLERVTNDALRAVARDDGGRFGGGTRIGTDRDVVLDAGVETFRVLADEHDVDVLESPARNDGTRRTYVRVQIERATQRDVDRPIATADGRLERALQRETRALDRLDGLVRHRIIELVDGGHAGEPSVPFEFGARRFENAYGRVGDVRSDAIAGDQRAGNAHMSFSSASGCEEIGDATGETSGDRG